MTISKRSPQDILKLALAANTGRSSMCSNLAYLAQLELITPEENLRAERAVTKFIDYCNSNSGGDYRVFLNSILREIIRNHLYINGVNTVNERAFLTKAHQGDVFLTWRKIYLDWNHRHRTFKKFLAKYPPKKANEENVK